MKQIIIKSPSNTNHDPGTFFKGLNVDTNHLSYYLVADVVLSTLMDGLYGPFVINTYFKIMHNMGKYYRSDKN